jgi:hypothetical protein
VGAEGKRMTLAEQRRERIAFALFFAIGIAGLCLGAVAKQQDNPTHHVHTTAIRG